MSSINEQTKSLDISNDELRVILEMIPAFRSKKTLIPYYIAFEFKNQQQPLIEFWSIAIKHTLKLYFKNSVFSLNELMNCFTINQFSPLSLQQIIELLIQSKEFLVIKEGIEKEIIQKISSIQCNDQISILQSITNLVNPYLIFKRKVEPLTPFQKLLHVNLFIEKFNEVVTYLPQIFGDKPIMSNQKFDHQILAHHQKILQDQEIELTKIILAKKGTLLFFDDHISKGKIQKCVIFQSLLNSSYDPQSLERIKLEFKIEQMLENLDYLSIPLEEEIQKLNNQIIEFIKKNNKSAAKLLIQQKNLVDQRYQNIQNQKIVLQKQLFSLQDQLTDKNVIETLKQFNLFQANNKIDINELEKIKDEIEEHDFNQQQVQQKFKNMNQQENDEINQILQRLEMEMNATNTLGSNINQNSQMQEEFTYQVKNEDKMQIEENKNLKKIIQYLE